MAQFSVKIISLTGSVLGENQQLWNPGTDNNSSRKFVVAPAASVIGWAVFGELVIGDRTLPGRRLQNLIWLGIAMCAVFLWSLSGHSLERFGVAYGLLLLTGVLLMAALSLVNEPLCASVITFAFVAAASLFAAGMAVHLGWVRVQAGKLEVHDLPILALVHGAVPLLVWLSIVGAARLQKWTPKMPGNGT
jgi:hypothetical protein